MPISDGLISARQLCSNSVDTRNIAPGAVTPTEVLTGFNFVELVTVLPTTGNFEGRMVYLTTDDKLYRHDGAAFLLAVDGADITAATISGDRMIANTITAGQIAVGTITATQIAANTITAAEIAANTITATELNVTTLSAITASMGTLTVDSTITMGTGGIFRTATSGQRIEITEAEQDRIRFFTGDSFEADSSTMRAGVSGSGSTRTLQTAIHAPTTTGDTNTMALIIRTESFNDSSFSPAIIASYAGGSSQTPQFRMETNIRFKLVDGTAAEPGLAFVSDSNTGMYRGGVDLLRLVANGSNRLQIAASSTIPSIGCMVDGTAAAPAFGFTADTNTGMYRVGVNELGLSAGGLRLRIDTQNVRATGGAHFRDDNPASAGTIDAQWRNVGGSARNLEEVSSMLSGKQDVVPLDDFLNTAGVFDLDLIAFRMKDDPDGPMHIGTVAASVGKHLPALAYKRGGRWDFGQYSRLVIPLIAEVRKLRDRVGILEAA